jgi:hypothetical protein
MFRDLVQLRQGISDLDLSFLTGWVIPIIGMVAAGLTFVVGRAIVNRRRASRMAILPADYIDPYAPDSTERRNSLRRGGNPLEVNVSDAEAKSEPTRGWVVDRSMGGICLRLEAPVAVGTLLSIRPREACPIIPWTQVEVRDCRPGDANTWEVGCQFVRMPSWSVLLLFG